MHVEVWYNFNTKLGISVLIWSMKPVLANVVLINISNSVLVCIFPQACCVTKRLMDSYSCKGKYSYMYTLKPSLLKFCCSPI